ncbi:MAG: Uma2 family endonuclease [Deltaproteobacteria bacterium]|nr:Uma2 family endonuclease [Deltaproteobacteria bacterium]
MFETIIEPSPPLRRFTRAELARLVALGFFREDERVELIHGCLVRMTPPGPPHSSAVDRLAEILLPRLLGRARVRIQQPFAASDDSEPEPDVAVVPIGDYSVDHPHSASLIVEVADSSLAYDRKTKGPLYAASAVPEYWVVNVPERTVEVHTAPEPGAYARLEIVRSGVLGLSAFPDVEVQVAELFPRQ